VHILGGLKPTALKRLERPLYGFVECEVYRVLEREVLNKPRIELDGRRVGVEL